MSKAKGTFWILLFMLLGLAIYQIVSIFWEAPMQRESGRWYSMAQPDPEANMLRPREIYFTLGGEDGSYGKMSKQDEQFEEVFQYTYDLMAYVLENYKPEAVDLGELPWNQEACVLDYDFEIDSDLVIQQLELKEPMTEGKWSEIWVLPAQSRKEKCVVYMLDQKTGIGLKAEGKAWEQDSNHLLLESLQNQAALQNRNYFAVAKAWQEPKLAGDYLLEGAMRETISLIQTSSNFLFNGRINLAQAKQYALQFFQYADTVKIKEDENQILCTNEKITVKVDDTGIVQYVETLTEEEQEAVTMKEAYQLAVGFVKKDLDWKSDFGLDFMFVGYEKAGNQYIFYFTYLIEGIPYQTVAGQDEQQMDFPIRVTVEGSRVRRYERYVISVAIDQSRKYTLEETWQNVINKTAAKGAVIKAVPELKYYYEKEELILYWEIETNQGKIRYKAQ